MPEIIEIRSLDAPELEIYTQLTRRQLARADMFIAEGVKSIESALDERERRIIIMRYGLDGKKEYTQREIASMMGISRSYVSRIETRALRKLRAKMES